MRTCQLSIGPIALFVEVVPGKLAARRWTSFPEIHEPLVAGSNHSSRSVRSASPFLEGTGNLLPGAWRAPGGREQPLLSPSLALCSARALRGRVAMFGGFVVSGVTDMLKGIPNFFGALKPESYSKVAAADGRKRGFGLQHARRQRGQATDFLRDKRLFFRLRLPRLESAVDDLRRIIFFARRR